MAKFIIRICEWCDNEFEAEVKNVKRGWGRFCSRSCTAQSCNSLRPDAKSKSKIREKARKSYIRRYGKPKCCECGAVPADVHHENGDPTDNRKKNLKALCRSCHMAHHNHIDPKRKVA